MKDLGHNECHKCGGEVKVIKKTDDFVNKNLKAFIRVTVPIWKCEECGAEVYPSESHEILKRCSGPSSIEKNATEMRQLIDLGHDLSTYAAESKLENTEEFLDGLFHRAEKYQKEYEELLGQLEGEKDG